MKTLLRFVLLLLFGPLANAQDTILKIDQTEVSAKVVEITTDEVKFKYANRLDGPTYTLKKSEVFVIIYKDGTREKFGPATPTPKATLTPVAEAPTRPTTMATRPAPSYVRSSDDSEIKRNGWTYGIGYSTPVVGFAEDHGAMINAGFYFLGSGRKGGGMIDADALYFFGDASPRFGMLALNGILRLSETSSFYIGSGIGYGTVSVEVPTFDRNGRQLSTERVGRGDLGGKSFMGCGIFRISYIVPSFEGDGLITIGLHTNPFK